MSEISNKKSIAQKVAGKIILYIVLCTLAVVFLYPYGFMLNRGLMSNERITSSHMYYFTDSLHFENYYLAFRDGGYLMPLLRSVLVCGITALSAPLTTLIAAYAFSRLEWIGKNFLFGFMMMLAIVPGIVTQVPLFVLYHSLNLIDTLYPLFLPGLFSAGIMSIFLMRQFLLGLSREIEESAMLEGAGPLTRCFYICAPLCKAMLIYLAVTSFMGAWGDFYTPSVYMPGEDAPFTFAAKLYYMTGRETNSAHPEWIFAAATIMSLVSTVLYIFFQKYLIEGIATAGLKS